jgi:beta-glucosidase
VAALTLGLLGGGLTVANAWTPGHPDDSVTALETAHANLARTAATEAVVLLDNSGKALPLASSGNVALFGTSAYATVKGGTGSGDVYQRYVVNVHDGFVNGGYTVTTNPTYWNALVAEVDTGTTCVASSFMSSSVDYACADPTLTNASVQPTAKTDTAVYVIGRNSGEGADRSQGAGDYLLAANELSNLKLVAKTYKNVIVLLNVGAVVDTEFYNEINDAVKDPAGGQALDALVLMSQLGQEGGNAIVDVLSGKVNPSGKTVDTWASEYRFYPASETIAMHDGISTQEDYTEGIYVGYRYFDSFYKSLKPNSPETVVNYPFGYGLSYTTFNIVTDSVTADKDKVTVKATVQNTGSVAGKEVVQVYFSAPTTGLDKPYQELAAYAKTDLIPAGQQQQVTITFDPKEMSSYDEALSAYRLEGGDYIIRVGNSSRSTSVAAILQIPATVTEQLSTQGADETLASELTSNPANFYSYDAEAAQIAAAPKISVSFAGFTAPNNASQYQPSVTLPSTSPLYYLDNGVLATTTAYIDSANASNWDGTGSAYVAKEGETIQLVTVPSGITLFDVAKGTYTIEQFVASLSLVQLADITQGGTGLSGAAVPSTLTAQGAAGYTTAKWESLGIASMVLADGPAGCRITQSGVLNGVNYWQFCTAWPIGTALAQTWNPDLIKQVGAAVGEEFIEYGITLWLAPGMNIHRDPMNGRNFEYYSEDPLVTGLTAAAITGGVQSSPGVGVTLKHYLGNNQETSRSGGNDTISERATREIYLKGFEIAVKQVQPMAIMSSYNKVNGTCVAAEHDYLDDMLRGEWGYDGLVMTDWGGCGSDVIAYAYAGNDLIEPGGSYSSVINSMTVVPPTIDVDGLPVAAYTAASSSPWGSSPASYTWSVGNLALSQTGTQVITTTVNSSIIGVTPGSGTSSGGGWGGAPATITPNAPYTSVQDAYDHVMAVISDTTYAPPTSLFGTVSGTPVNSYSLSQAQVEAITVSNVVGSPPSVTSFDVTIKGEYATNMRLGDLQKSAIRILKVVARSQQFAELAQVQGVSGITAVPYTASFSNLTNYVGVTKGALAAIPPAPQDPTTPSSTKVNLATATVKAGWRSYTGKQVKPGSITVNGVKLVEGTDFTYTSLGTNKAIGKGTAVITGTGNHEGTKTVTFKIVPAKSKIKALTPGKKTLKVTWKKSSSAQAVSGYQVAYKVKGAASFKTKTVTGASKTSLTLSGLKKGKQYTIKVRAYKKISGVSYVGPWTQKTSAKKVK